VRERCGEKFSLKESVPQREGVDSGREITGLEERVDFGQNERKRTQSGRRNEERYSREGAGGDLLRKSKPTRKTINGLSLRV